MIQICNFNYSTQSLSELMLQKLEYRSLQIDYRQTLSLGGINYQLQIQNRAARRINFHYSDRPLGISAEKLS